MTLLWHLSVIKNSRFILISGVILSMKGIEKKGFSIKNKTSIPESYFKKTYANRDVIIRINNKKINSKTNKYGDFSISTEVNDTSKIQLFDDKDHEIQKYQEYPVVFEQKQSGPLVISDIDDTIMRSFTKTKIKRLITTLFKTAAKRQVISYTQQLYESFGENADFFYVSKSENNLFYLISGFLLHNELPLGPLFLTPFLNASQLLFEKKNASFKFDNICNILDHSSNKKVILIGDDTQSDMDIYYDIIKVYKDRIEKVYIRQTKTKRSKKQLDQWKRIEATGVTAYYYKHDEILTTKQQL
ncbi:phosphatidate phosphatase App1 family protein [Lutimonas sp.]|uniref:phosphatidate phosphatase App1 family protein n=1 Tax=Lutimonas sp. TaxID=1872403 RepID=UPI003D9BED3D